MKLFTVLIIAIVLFAISCNGNSNGVKNVSKPNNKLDSTSYALGNQMGSQFHRDSAKLNLDYFIAGFTHAIHGDSALLTASEIQSLVQTYYQSMTQKQEVMQKEQSEKLNELGEKLKDKNQKFLDEYKAAPGAKVTSSGLMYKILKEGDGKKPELDDIVEFHLVGTFADGSEFDNTHSSKQPVVLPVNQAFPGWKEALPMMKTGSKWEVVVPGDLGFGPMGYPPKNIPPNAVLICKIELLSIKGKAAQQNPMMPGQLPPGIQRAPAPLPLQPK